MRREKTLLLISGHTKKAQGADAHIPAAYWNQWRYGEYGDSISEYEFANIILPLVKEICEKHGVNTFLDTRDKGWRQIKINAAKYFKQTAMTKDFVHLSLELHFNCFSKSSANGVEILVQQEDMHTKNPASLLAQRFSELSEITLRRTDGLKILDHSDAGDNNLDQIERISLHETLFEMFFGSCPADCSKIFRKKPQEIAEMLAESILHSFYDIDIHAAPEPSVPSYEPVDYVALRLKLDNAVAKYHNLKDGIQGVIDAN